MRVTNLNISLDLAVVIAMWPDAEDMIKEISNVNFDLAFFFVRLHDYWLGHEVSNEELQNILAHAKAFILKKDTETRLSILKRYISELKRLRRVDSDNFSNRLQKIADEIDSEMKPFLFQ